MSIRKLLSQALRVVDLYEEAVHKDIVIPDAMHLGKLDRRKSVCFPSRTLLTAFNFDFFFTNFLVVFISVKEDVAVVRDARRVPLLCAI